MSRAARDYSTWFIEEPEYHDEAPALRIVRDASGVSVVTPQLPHGHENADALLKALISRLHASLGAERLIAWYYTPMALRYTDELSAHHCVYDNMDELSTFAGAPPGLLQWEQRLVSRCDVVFVGGHSLYRAKRSRHNNIHVFPSSVDAAHFHKARGALPEPDDQAAIPHPRLGFFGVIDERMNIDLVERIAAIRPDWHLVMIGPTAKIDPGRLPRARNIHWLGCKDYKDLPKYLAGWDVGFMPFAINEATRFISPTKTPEFLAAGVPVVSTPITDVVEPYGTLGLVEIAQDAEGFVDRAEALMRRDKIPWLRKVDASLGAMSWDDTWAGMKRHLDAVLPHPENAAEARRV